MVSAADSDMCDHFNRKEWQECRGRWKPLWRGRGRVRKLVQPELRERGGGGEGGGEGGREGGRETS
jgi:hypothetical protein